MSLTSWKARFYPVEANRACSNAIEALKHSILKWSGATKANLSAHGLVKLPDSSGIYYALTGSEFNFGTESCALCQLTKDRDGVNCNRCPIVLHLGHECYGCNKRGINAYARFMDHYDPRSMIVLLKKALAKEEKAAKVKA